MLALAGPGAKATDWQALTSNSPFGQPAAPAPVAPDELEFRGVVQEDGVYLVNLFNPTTKTSQWVPVNGRVPGLEVRTYDARADKIEITHGGRPLTLALKQAKVALVQPAPAMTAAAEPSRPTEGAVAAGPRPQPGEPGAMVRNLPPEAQAMIQEFRRRRAERASQMPPQQQRPRPQPQRQQQP